MLSGNRSLAVCCLLGRDFYPEDGGSMYLRNWHPLTKVHVVTTQKTVIAVKTENVFVPRAS
jgi:hypothetical protein